MILPPDLSQLTHPEKDALILVLAEELAAAQERIATQDARIAALEARLDALPPGEDAGQFVQAALARPEAGPPVNRAPATQEPPRRRADAASEP